VAKDVALGTIGPTAPLRTLGVQHVPRITLESVGHVVHGSRDGGKRTGFLGIEISTCGIHIPRINGFVFDIIRTAFFIQHFLPYRGVGTPCIAVLYGVLTPIDIVPTVSVR
jgi:hypothetical protein